MSTVSGESPRNLSQQRKLAKDLLKAARASEADAIVRLRAIRPSGELKLADAQLAIARAGGFDSWPKLVKNLEADELRKFKEVITRGEAAKLRAMLKSSVRLRKKVNDPMFDFGRRPINAAAKHVAVIDVLVEFGADINARSDWDKGPYGVLDECPEEVAPQLIARGAKLSACAAARLGWMDQLKAMIDANPSAIDEKGGDGQRPLHYAKTTEIATFLLEHGAKIDARCDDHNSTAAQYALKDRPELTRFLLDRGALPDIFMAARLGDVFLSQKLIDDDPSCVAARIGTKGYDRVPAFGIYNWVLGFYKSPHEVANEFDHRTVSDLLWNHSTPKVRFLDAAMRADEASARAAMRDDPSLPGSLATEDHSLLAMAALGDRFKAFKLMLELGFDPMARGMDGGTVLHMAAWIGHVEMIDALLARRVDVNIVDHTHGSTPLGWTAHGSVHRRRDGADYPAVIERLVAAGANVNAPGNKYGSTIEAMGNPAVQATIDRLRAAS